MKTPNTLIEEIVDDYVSGDRNKRAILDIERLLKDFTSDITDYACAWFEKYLAEIGYPDDWLRDSEVQESGEKRFRKFMDANTVDDGINEGEALFYVANKVAERTKKEMINKAKGAFNKACDWLSTYPWYQEVLDRFIKAMEEE